MTTEQSCRVQLVGVKAQGDGRVLLDVCRATLGT